MDILTFIAALSTPILAFLGVIYGKKKEASKIHDEAVANCQKIHKGDIENVKTEFKDKLDSMSKILGEIQAEQVRSALFITQLQEEFKELKESVDTMIEKENELDKHYSVLEEKEKASEIRIKNLEIENKKH